MTDSTHALVVCVDSVYLGFGSPSIEVMLFSSEEQAVDSAIDRLVQYGLYEAIAGKRFLNLPGGDMTFEDKATVLDDFDAALDSGEYFRVIQVREQDA